MPLTSLPETITVLDVSQFTYAERVCAAALQGLVNRSSPSLYLDYGIYDDPAARRTNEVFLDEELWQTKYRALLGNQDQRNLAYYQQKYGFTLAPSTDLPGLVARHIHELNGLVVWDEALPDTVNIALMLAARENLLPVTAAMADAYTNLGLAIKHDLRGRWQERVSLYRWAFDNLFNGCKPGYAACVEPGWQRPEFLDYIVQQQLFVYSLSATAGGLGSRLLLLLAFGPPYLREFLFALRLDGLFRKFALAWMGLRSAEVRLSNRIQRAVKALPYPTLFGWHTRRDDELAFMLQLTSNGLRLVPSHLAGNFSFHGGLPSRAIPQEPPAPAPVLDPQGIYLTFTLSDGDQLMMMHTAELGNWSSPLRGRVPFNWEVQPLLHTNAPALLERYTSSAVPNDCLIAGPSGAGYIVPPLAPRLGAYMDETTRVCAQTGISVVTTYVADPPARVMRQLASHRGSLTGYLAGYAVVTRAPMQMINGMPVLANRFPSVEQIALKAPDLLAKIREAVETQLKTQRNTPVFIGVHLFAYRTTYEDIVRFVESLPREHVHTVRADEFILLFQESDRRKQSGK